MEPIFDRTGKPVGWLREDIVFDLRGANIAFVFRGALFGYNGQHIGSYAHKFFLDEHGRAVAFVKGASGVLVPSLPSSLPVPPTPEAPPPPPKTAVKAIPSIPPVHSLSWSGHAWEDFIRPRT